MTAHQKARSRFWKWCYIFRTLRLRVSNPRHIKERRCAALSQALLKCVAPLAFIAFAVGTMMFLFKSSCYGLQGHQVFLVCKLSWQFWILLTLETINKNGIRIAYMAYSTKKLDAVCI